MEYNRPPFDLIEDSKIELRWRTWWRYAEAELGHQLEFGDDADVFYVEDASESFWRGESPALYVNTLQSSQAYKRFRARLLARPVGEGSMIDAWENEGGAAC
jgi:hypothetical protein